MSVVKTVDELTLEFVKESLNLGKFLHISMSVLSSFPKPEFVKPVFVKPVGLLSLGYPIHVCTASTSCLTSSTV